MYKNIIYFICVGLLTFTFLLLLKGASGKTRFSTRLFSGITFFTAIWASCLWIADTTSSIEIARLFLNFAVFFLTLVTWLFLMFAVNFPEKSKRFFMPLIVATLLYNAVFLLFATGQLIITEVSTSSFGASIEQANVIYTLHTIQSISFILIGLLVLNIKKRHLETKDKLRVNFMTFGTTVALVGNILSGTLATYVQGLAWFNIVATISTVSFVLIIGYAITKHQLFDVKLIIARSLGYIFSIVTLAAIYGFIAFTLISRFLFTENTSVGFQQSIYTVLAVILAFTFQPMRKYFDRLTNKLFYRDAYDSQVLLDELNKILVGNIDIQPLLRQCAELFETTLKAEYCTFIIKETNDTTRRIIGSKKVSLDEEQILELSSQNHKIDQIIVADELEESQTTLKTMLSKNNVSILARLAPAGKNAVEQGYLVLGAKRSGNPYNKQDLQVLDIIANELVIAIQNALRFEEIEAFTVTLQEKVNEATRQLRRTNEKLKALDETKDEFISMASHQLRTPLTAVKGYVSMVVEGDAGKLNKQQKELLDQAFASSQRMVYLIADLLNVSRLKTGKFVIENKQTNLAEVVEAEIEQLKQAAAGKQQTLTYTKPTKFPDLMLDETKMRQVIMNFTDNALHYTPNGGHIEVKLEDKGQSVEFTVVDDGLGVPKSEQHHLFGKFFRAGNARKARPDGTGLGLFMAKKVIIAQGGAVIFSSTEGKGSTFGFTMPKKK